MTKRTMLIAAITAFVAFAAGYAMLGGPIAAVAAPPAAALPSAARQLDADQLAELLAFAGSQPRVVVLDGPAATLGTSKSKHDDDDDHHDDDHHKDRKSDARDVASASERTRKERDHD